MRKPRTEIEARYEAYELAQRLERAFGVKWDVCVWNNLGWTYTVSYGYLTVYREHCGYRRYYALLGSGRGGYSGWADHRFSTDPVRVVLHQLKVANEHLQELHQLVLDSVPIRE